MAGTNKQIHLIPHPSYLSPHPSALNPQPSTLSPQPSALNPQPSSLSPQPSVLLTGQEARAGLGNMGQFAVTDNLGVGVVHTQ